MDYFAIHWHVMCGFQNILTKFINEIEIICEKVFGFFTCLRGYFLEKDVILYQTHSFQRIEIKLYESLFLLYT